MNTRETFEAWMGSPPYEREVERLGDDSAWPGSYVDLAVDLAWLAYSEATAVERERCAKVCDAICDEHWSRYKGTKPNAGHPARGSYYAEGMSDGAGLCADAIRRGE